MIGHYHDDHDIDWTAARRINAMRASSAWIRWRREHRPRIDQSYDIAYIAGISNDAMTVYVDRDFPLRHLPVGDVLANVTDEIVYHEGDEQIYIERFGDHYPRAHRLVTVGEHDIAVKRRLPWHIYKYAYLPFVKADENLHHVRRSPRDLYLRPYRDSQDFKTIERIKQTMV